MLREPRCFARQCKHFLGVNDVNQEVEQLVVCKAFPEGIPDEIAYGDDLHLKPVEGDRGIQYEKVE